MNLLGGGQQSGLMALAFILLTHFGDTIPKDINQTVFLFYKLFSLHQNGAKMTTDVKSEISQEHPFENVLMR